MANAKVGDEGVAFRLTMTDSLTGGPLDLTGTTITFVFRSPTNERFERTAGITGSPTDGVATYLTGDGDLSSGGWWKLQGRVEKLGVVLHSDAVRFFVSDVL